MDWHFVIMAILGTLGAALAAGGIVAYRASARVSVRAFGAAAIAAGVVIWTIILFTTPLTATRGDAPPLISGIEGHKYEVMVWFNTTATQDDLDEVGALLRTFDDDVEFLFLEIFPPIGQAVLTTDAPDFCHTVETALEAESYVDDASCRLWQAPDQVEPDAPVSTDNDATS